MLNLPASEETNQLINVDSNCPVNSVQVYCTPKLTSSTQPITNQVLFNDKNLHYSLTNIVNKEDSNEFQELRSSQTSDQTESHANILPFNPSSCTVQDGQLSLLVTSDQLMSADQLLSEDQLTPVDQLMQAEQLTSDYQLFNSEEQMQSVNDPGSVEQHEFSR